MQLSYRKKKMWNLILAVSVIMSMMLSSFGGAVYAVEDSVPNEPEVSATAEVPQINKQPAGVTVNAGETATFTVTAAVYDEGTLSYQWHQSLDKGSVWDDIPEATAESYTTEELDIADSGNRYRCMVVNNINETTASALSDAATLTVNAASTTADKEITAAEDIEALEVPYGTAINELELPQDVTVTLADDSTSKLSVNWDEGTPAYDGNTAGTYRFSGTLLLPDEIINTDEYKASVEVTVLAQEVQTDSTADSEVALDIMVANSDDIIEFPDPNFKMMLTDPLSMGYVDTNKDGEISISEAQAVTILSVNVQNDLDDVVFSSIEGIEYFTSLESFSFSFHKVCDLSPLAGLTNLTKLDMSKNQISDLSPLAELKNLTKINMSKNQISDLSPLAGLTKLTNLDLSDNLGITDIEPLLGLTSLKELNLTSNDAISNIDLLAQMKSLTNLDLSNSNLSNISHLAELINLTKLVLYSNNIEDISCLSELTKLTELNLMNNKVSDINPLAELTNLTELNLCANEISDIRSLTGLTALEELDLSSNDIYRSDTINGMHLAELDFTVAGNLREVWVPAGYVTDSNGMTVKGLNSGSASVTLELYPTTFADDTLDKGNFILNNAPEGLTVSEAEYIDDKHVILHFAYTGPEINSNIKFQITVKGIELMDNSLDLFFKDDVPEITAGTSGNWADVYSVSEAVEGTDYSFDGTYHIKTAKGLDFIADNVNGDYYDYVGQTVVLDNDIDLSERFWTPIGIKDDWGTSYSFKGTFDGQGHKITGLYIGTSDTPNENLDYAGLFGNIAGATIQNVAVDNCAVYAAKDDAKVGGLAGYAASYTDDDDKEYFSKIINCYVTGEVTGGSGWEYAYIGGLVGSIDGNDSAVVNCYSTANVTGGDNTYIGGLIGSINGNDSAIMNCYSRANVTGGDSTYIGGLVGGTNAPITNCYATGDITGGNVAYAGGLIGENNVYITTGYWNSSAAQTVDGNSQSQGDGYGGLMDTSMAAVEMQKNDFAYTLNNNQSFIYNIPDGVTLAEWGRADDVNDGYPVFAGIGEGSGVPSAGTGPTTVTLTADSLMGTASNEKITGLESGKVYKVTVDPEGAATVKYTTSAGTLTETVAEKAELGGTEITGLINGQTYKVEANWAYVADMAKENDDYIINGDAYTINTPLGLAWLASEVNSATNDFADKTVELAADIDLAKYCWTPIGLGFDNSFQGTFEGKDKIISNVKVGTKDSPDATFEYAGLFGWTEHGTIENVGVKDCAIYSAKENASVGGLVGHNAYNNPITSCYATGTIEGVEGSNTGGLAGHNMGGSITNCYATGTVKGSSAGGLVGKNENCITNCYATGTVKGNSAGGLVGHNNDLCGVIINCYATGAVTGSSEGEASVGGLVGENSKNSTITKGYWRNGAAAKGVGNDTGEENTIGMDSTAMQNDTFAYTLNKNQSDITSLPPGVTLADWGRADEVNDGYPVFAGIGDGTDIPSAGMEPKTVILTADSLVGTAGNAKITCLESGKVYKVTVDPEGAATVKYTTSAGTLTETAAEKAELGGTEITGLTNGQTYKVEANWAYVADMAKENDDYIINGDTYTINTPLGLAWFASEVNSGTNNFAEKTVELAADIDLAKYYWTPIGIYRVYGDNKRFKGYFEGNEYTISNVKIGTEDSPDKNFKYVGLFGWAKDGTIKDVEIKDCAIYSAAADSTKIGGLAGSISDGTIKNCYATGTVTGNNAGGLVGSNNDSTITNCYAAVTIEGSCAGGLIYDNGGTINNCYATGTVTGSDNVGGLVGYNHKTITNCYATGNVEGVEDISSYVGGLVGHNSQGTIMNCYATGNVKGVKAIDQDAAGGLVGSSFISTITNCYATGAVTGGSSYIGGLVGYIYCSTMVGAPKNIITNCYATGNVTGSSEEASVGGLVGSNPEENSIINNGYWNRTAVQMVNGSQRDLNDKKGVGNDTGESNTMGMDSTAMQNNTFAQTLNENQSDIDTTELPAGVPLAEWGRADEVNDGYPVFSGMGDGTDIPPTGPKPTVTDANIFLSGATGTDGTFKVGDIVTTTWDNTAAGDNNSDTITGVTVDFSQFGGGAAVTASANEGKWTATYTMVAGIIDATNKNVAVTATNAAGDSTTTADTSNASVDNQVPTVTAAHISINQGSGTDGTFKVGDTVTATWDNTEAGDNNSDTIVGVTVDFSQFGGGAAVTASANEGTWTATYTIKAGTIDATNKNIAVTAIDNAGNATTTAGTSNAILDNQAPKITSHAIADITATAAKAQITVNEDATAYYVVLDAAATAPTQEQVKAGQNATGTAAAIKGSAEVSAAAEHSLNISSLTVGKSYKIYLVAIDKAGNISQIASDSFTTNSLEISINDVTVTEGATGTTTTAEFIVSLTEPGTESITVDYATEDGTAAAGSDYIAASGTITFSPGETSKNITITVNGDGIDEDDETFKIKLSNPVNATIANGQGTGTITDDDATGFTITETDGTQVSEAGSTDTFTIVLDAQPQSNVVVDITSGDTGEVTVDPAEVTFTAADWNIPQAVTVTGVADEVIDGEQTTTITVSVNAAGSDTAFASLDNQTVDVITTDANTIGNTLLPDEFTAIEGVHTNFLDYLYSIEGVSESGATLSLGAIENANIAEDGTISYTAAEVIGDVTVKINQESQTEQTKVIAVTVSAHEPTDKELADAAISKAQDLLPDEFTAIEGVHTNLLAYLNSIEGIEATGVTLSIGAIENANIAADGAIRYIASEVIGDVAVKINKAPGTESTETIAVTVSAHEPTDKELADAAISKAQDLLPDEFTAIEGVHTNLLAYLNSIEGIEATGVTLSLGAIENANIATDGTISYTATEVIGDVAVKINKAPGTESTETIAVTVPAHEPSVDDLQEDFASLKIGYAPGDNAQHVTRNLYLSKAGESGRTTITWESSAANITSTGRVMRPAADASDLTVTLTATITHDVTGVQKTKVFTVKVLKKTTKDSLQEAARNLSIQFAPGDTWECVTLPFTILSKGLHNTQIKWTSSKPDIIRLTEKSGKMTGIVNRPQKVDTNVILTAHLSLGEYEITKTFLLVVKNQAVTKDDSDVRQTTSREADVKVGQEDTENKDNVEILRTELNNGTKIDTVIVDQAKLEKLTERINPDDTDADRRTVTVQITQPTTDPADEIAVELPAASLAAMADKNAGLDIKTDEGSVSIENEELQDVAQTGTDLYFRIVPVKDEKEQDEVKDNLSTNKTVVEAADGAPINALSIPRKIETNFSGRNARVALPLTGIEIPDNDREAFLDSMRIFIEHSDGSIELLKGTLQYANGQPITIEFIISKFSRFQILNFYEGSSSGSSDDDDHHHSHHSSSSNKNDYVTVYVNEEGEKAGILTTAIEEGQSIHKITVDAQKLEQKLKEEGKRAIVTVPFSNKTDQAIAVFSGKQVKDMARQQVVIKVKTKNEIYTLPAAQIDIEATADKLGKNKALDDIDVQISIAKPREDMVKTVEKVAKGKDFTIKVPAVDFTVQCSSNDETVKVANYNAYVQRSIAIPEDTNHRKITTAVVVEPDGSVRHVPTKVTKVNGNYYAQISSLTDSTYVLIWHPMEFKDVRGHWAEADINDMGSRMVVSGVGHEQYEPDRDITRAEFATIMVRALGLKPGTGSNPFGDVAEDTWYCDCIKTAHAYGIINGYGDNIFKPLNPITREEAMAMVAHAMDITGLGEKEQHEFTQLLEKYTDVAQVAAWAKSSIASCVNQDIVTGKSANMLAPQDNITRAEVAAIVSRLLRQSDLI